MTTRLHALRTTLIERSNALVGPRRLPVAALGVVLLIIGLILPWTTFNFGYPGELHRLLGAEAPLVEGGVRTLVLLLLPFALLQVRPIHGRRHGGIAATTGILVLTVITLLALAREGEGFGAVAAGPWVALAGGLLLLAAFLAMTDDGPDEPTYPRLPVVAELVVIGVLLAVLLFVIAWGLEIEDPLVDQESGFLGMLGSQFVAFLVVIGYLVAAVYRLGVVDWLQQVAARHRIVMYGGLLVAAIAFPFTQQGDAYWIRVFATVGVFAAAAIGLNVVVGLAGLLDLGYIAFFGVGAYVGALYANDNPATQHTHLPFLVALLVGALAAAAFGVVIGAPTLRLRGDYLAIVTLGFGEIFRITANNWDGLTNGPNGIPGVKHIAVSDFNFGEEHTVFGVELPGFANYYFIEVLLLVVVILAFLRLNQSRIGRAWIAIREDETAAQAMGVNTVRLKLLAFAIGAFIAGAAGTVNAHVTTQVSPDSYTFEESILLLAAVVLGGMGTVPGAILGAAMLKILPERLRMLGDKRILLFGVALILMMRFRPEGIAASKQRQREFHETEGGADALGAVPGSAASA